MSTVKRVLGPGAKGDIGEPVAVPAEQTDAAPEETPEEAPKVEKRDRPRKTVDKPKENDA